jgi:hypothetical protein
MSLLGQVAVEEGVDVTLTCSLLQGVAVEEGGPEVESLVPNSLCGCNSMESVGKT